MAPGTGQLAVRETFFDRRVDRPADLRVELVGGEPPPVLGVEELAGKLEFAGVFVQFVAATAVNMWHDTADNVNTFGGTAGAEHVAAQDDEVRSHSNAEMTYHGGRWVLGEGEALVVTVHDPPTEFLYWGLTTSTAWMESLDYRYTTTNLNNHTAAAFRRRGLAAGHLTDRPWRAELVGHPGTARGLHDRALGAGRRPAPPHLRAGADRQPPGELIDRVRSDLGRDREALLVVRDERAVLGEVEAGVLEAVVVRRRLLGSGDGPRRRRAAGRAPGRTASRPTCA